MARNLGLNRSSGKWVERARLLRTCVVTRGPHLDSRPAHPLIRIRALMAKWLRRLRLSESGQGLIEYCLIVSVVAAALTAVLFSLRNSTGNVYSAASNSLDQVVGCSYGSSSSICASGTSGTSTSGGSGGDASGSGIGNGGGNGRGNHGNGNGNGGGDGSNGKGGGKGNQR